MIDDLVGAEFPVRYGTPAASRRRFNNAVAVVGAQQEFQHRRARDILTKLTFELVVTVAGEGSGIFDAISFIETRIGAAQCRFDVAAFDPRLNLFL